MLSGCETDGPGGVDGPCREDGPRRKGRPGRVDRYGEYENFAGRSDPVLREDGPGGAGIEGPEGAAVGGA